MRVRLDYGNEGLELDVPERASILEMSPTPGLQKVSKCMAEAFRQPIGTPPLAALAAGRHNACIVISDITRPVPNPVILPPMLGILEAAGIGRDQITILIGTGLHRPNLGEELALLVGPQIAAEYRVVNHDARDVDGHSYLGQTSMGMPIWADRRYAEADLKIATSLIEPHLMAGFSGGRKAICPGIMGVDTIRVFHGPQILAHPRAAEGIIEGNPVHRQSLEAAQRTGADFTVNVVMNDRRQVTEIFCGELEKAHDAGVRYLEEEASAYIDEPADIVITSSAGFPLDLTFYQSVKGLTAVAPIVRDGGTILMAARCEEGLGGREFADIVTSGLEPADFLRQLEDPDFFSIDQWQVQKLCSVAEKADVGIFSQGITEFAPSIKMVQHLPDLSAALGQALNLHGPEATIAVVPRGPYVLCRTRGKVNTCA